MDEIKEEEMELGGGLDISELVEDDNGESTDHASGGIEIIEDEPSSAEGENVEAIEEMSYNSLARPVYDVPPPDLSQVGKRMDDKEHWYVLHTFNGYEAVAEDNLRKIIDKYDLHDRVSEIYIPTEDVVTEKRGKKVLVPTRTMPSYIFIKMVYGDDLWHTITRTRGITGFVGPKGRPLPLSSKEVAEMKLERKLPTHTSKLEEGDQIQVVDGTLAGQSGTVLSVDAVAEKCVISITMFNKPTQVELGFANVKKV